ncbi:MAG: DUF5110 domain-containing protein [Clostridia bacterium]|nr:DUF5110 domain-containing protein [Clostridia bacterium]
MKKVTCKQLANGIFRITDTDYAGKLTLTERYSILTPVSEDCTDGASYDAESTTLNVGKLKLKLAFRPDSDDKFWGDASSYLLDKFKDRHLNHVVAEGNPNTEIDLPDDDNAAMLISSDVHFGVSIEVGEKERFYGLGEASRDKLELRGRAYQNWTYYQYNEIPTPFFMSSAGWGMLINANGRHFVDLCEQYDDKAIVCGEHDHLDVFILYGTMPEMLRSYMKLTGKSMLLPGWAYGLTYIAPIHANQFEVMSDAERFRKEKIPVDMFSLEPGWMTKFYDYSTNTEWDLKKFHMPPWHKSRECPDTFVAALKRMGIHLSLWFCDRYDLTDEAERQYRGDDNNKFEPWYKHLGEQTEFGVDGFKLDPADFVWKCEPNLIYSNGVPQMQMHNLNQVLLTKQTYEGFKNQTGLRPMHHYCGGYMGSQKWSASTTGDNGGEHGAMIWLLTLAMSGFSNTTIDMHIFKPESLHFGFLVPWAHLNAWSGVRQPWWAGEENYKLFKFYAKLRYRLFPYIYSAAIEAHEDAIPMVRPLPLMFPEFEDGFDNVCQYMFGPSLMVCAYTDTVSLPEGKWEDYWTGKIYEGPVTMKVDVTADRGGALFVKRGSIIPASATELACIRDYDKSVIELDVYPEGESEYILREDDMTTPEYETKESCHTLITCKATDENTVITIGAPYGDYNGKPESRRFKINVYGGSKNITVKAEADGDTCTVNYTVRK